MDTTSETSLQRTAAEAADRLRLLERAEELCDTGSWVWDEDAQRLGWSRRARTILGLRDGDHRRLGDLVHPDDRQLRTHDAFDAATTPLTIEYRIVRLSDGRTRWLREVGVAELHPDGRLARVYGAITDVTAAREALESEREQTAILDAIFAAAPLRIVLYDRDLRYVRVNETYSKWSGRPISEHVGLRVDDVYPGLGEQVEPVMRHVIATGQPVSGVESSHSGRWFRSSRYPVTGPDGEVAMVANIIDDITEIKRLEEALAEQVDLASARLVELERMQAALTEQASTDALTGIPNRRHFSEQVRAAWARSRRYGTGIAVLLIDLDDFKEINDAQGHAAGDRVLRATADVVRAAGRAIDVPVRLGGDEFVLLLTDLPPGVGATAVEAVTTRLRTQLDEIGVEASIGAATSEEIASGAGAETIADALLRAADADMYRTKSARRAERRQLDAA